jgi:mannose-6-phosphate isomerase-like protein (cupin superfamily)
VHSTYSLLLSTVDKYTRRSIDSDVYPFTKKGMKMVFSVPLAIQRRSLLESELVTRRFGVIRSVLTRKLPLRTLSVVLFTLAALSSMACEAQTQAAPGASEDQVLSQPRVFLLDQLPVHKMANGGESRNIIRGALATGEVVALHESVLPVGSAPNPPHKIEHSEFIIVLEGKLAFEHDGKSESAGQGDAILVAVGTLHTLRNVGDVPAKYVVVAIGGDIKK